MAPSCEICIRPPRVELNGQPLGTAEPVAAFHALLGPPDRIVPAGSPAPVGHRNNHIHFYDRLGITLSEHHYTYQIQGMTAVLSLEATHPTRELFTGRLHLGGVELSPGALERDLGSSSLTFTSWLSGRWFAHVSAESGRRVSIAVRTQGPRLKSGRRSKKRVILDISLGFDHDPWDGTYRPRDAT